MLLHVCSPRHEPEHLPQLRRPRPTCCVATPLVISSSSHGNPTQQLHGSAAQRPAALHCSAGEASWPLRRFIETPARFVETPAALRCNHARFTANSDGPADASSQLRRALSASPVDAAGQLACITTPSVPPRFTAAPAATTLLHRNTPCNTPCLSCVAASVTGEVALKHLLPTTARTMDAAARGPSNVAAMVLLPKWVVQTAGVAAAGPCSGWSETG